MNTPTPSHLSPSSKLFYFLKKATPARFQLIFDSFPKAVKYSKSVIFSPKKHPLATMWHYGLFLSLCLFLNEGIGFGQDVFGPQQVITTAASGANSVYATDIDGDGDMDVLSASYFDDKIAWYQNDGSGGFGPQQVITTAANAAISVYATDIDGDGDMDVLSASRNDDKIAWYENDGSGGFGPQQVITTAANQAYSVYASDVDGDGDMDVLSASFDDDKIAWYKNDGSGSFGSQQIITTAADYAVSVYATDIDGDGDMDVLSASFFDNKIAWYENLLALNLQVFENNPPCLGSNTGSLQAQLSGITTAPYTYTLTSETTLETLTGSSTTDNFIIADLAADTYTLEVINAAMDTASQSGIELTAIPGSFFEIIDITTTNSSNGLSNGSITITSDGGSPDFTFSWSGVATGSFTGSDGFYTIPDLYAGTYNIVVTDGEGNAASHTVTLLDETLPNNTCDAPMDIVILNDVSGSVDGVEYAESKQFFVDFVSALNVGTGVDDSRVAIVEWSETGQQNLNIPITGNIATLQSYTSHSRSFDGGTYPQDALTYGYNYLETEARPDATRVLVLSTDGSGGQISGSLVALADTYKAQGYIIVTIAFDNAFSNSSTQNILQQTASIDLLAPGAAAYSLLDDDLANYIVYLYVCPSDPGSSNTVYFNRDGAIEIMSITANDFCPNPESITVEFTVTAQQQLSLPAGTPVTFYYNNPALFGATQVLTTYIPCAIAADASETLTVTLPVTGPANIWVALNDDGSQSPPISFPITEIEEAIFSNNIDNMAICTDPIATLSALKYTTTPQPICGNTVFYTIDVCNISDVDATGVEITDVPPTGFDLVNVGVNDNGCASGSMTFDIPAGCCVTLSLEYHTEAAETGFYNNQGVALSGPGGQIYYDFDGSTTSAEDVTIGEDILCDSDVVLFSKTVNTTATCDDSFVSYTFTIDNQSNVALQGVQFSDLLPSPVIWAAEPYFLNGLSIAGSSITGSQTADFTIAEIAPETVASFVMDAYLGEWTVSGILENTAMLSALPDFVNGDGLAISSSSESIDIFTAPTIATDSFLEIYANEAAILAATVTGGGDLLWTTEGDGFFSDPTASTTLYNPGEMDILEGFAHFTLTVQSPIEGCGEAMDTVFLQINPMLCTVPEPPISLTDTIMVCTGFMNTLSFTLQHSDDVLIAWFATNNPADMEVISWDAEAVFENSGTYYAATYQVVSGDTCFSESRTPFTIFEIVLSVENSGDATIMVGESVDIWASASSNFSTPNFTLEWESELGLSDYFIENPVAMPDTTTTYTAFFEEENGCTIETHLTITVLQTNELEPPILPPPSHSTTVLLPSAFSPNEDGVNDYFQPVQSTDIQTIRLSIFNRWGESVFHSEDASPKWDGRFKGQMLEMGVYVFVYEYFQIGEEGVQVLKGNVTLVY